MKKVLTLIVAATIGLSSVAFAADTATSAPATTTTTPVAKGAHHNEANKQAAKKTPEQKALATKKHSNKPANKLS